MKKFLLSLLAVCIFTSGNIFAQVQSDLVIFKGVEINIDGKPDDHIWSLIEPVPITKVFNEENPTVTAYFKMFYTNEYLYLLVDVTDDVHYPAWIAESNQHWMYDKIEVYFDVNDVLKDGKGPMYDNGYMAPGHYQFAPPFEEAAYEIPYLPQNVLYGSLSNEVFVCYALKDDYKSYTVEYEIPFYAFKNDRGESLNLNAFKSLPNGLGFDIIVVDNDNDGFGRKRAVWKNFGPTESYVNMDNCGVVTFSEGVAGLSKTLASNAVVYPNPVKDILTIKESFDEVLITNIAGQTIRKITNSNQNINLSELPEGVYILKTFENGLLKHINKITKR